MVGANCPKRFGQLGRSLFAGLGGAGEKSKVSGLFIGDSFITLLPRIPDGGVARPTKQLVRSTGYYVIELKTGKFQPE